MKLFLLYVLFAFETAGLYASCDSCGTRKTDLINYEIRGRICQVKEFLAKYNDDGSLGAEEKYYDIEFTKAGMISKLLRYNQNGDFSWGQEFFFDEKDFLTHAIYTNTHGDKRFYKNDVCGRPVEVRVLKKDSSVYRMLIEYDHEGNKVTRRIIESNGELLTFSNFTYNVKGMILTETNYDADSTIEFMDEYFYDQSFI